MSHLPYTDVTEAYEESATDAAFDALVCGVVGQLEAGQKIDLEAIAAERPAHADRLRKLLPTLEAMVALSASESPSSPPPCGEGLGEGVSVLRGSPDPAGVDHTSGLLGDFRILREIGRGGMGVVYEAEQISIGRRVALKVLPFAAMLDKQQLNRFKNEARAAGTLDHPNIVAIYSVGCERGVHYYAMQLIEGQSLAQVVEQQVGAASRAARQAAGDCPNFAESAQQNGPVTLSQAAAPSALDTAPIAHLSTLPDFDSREYYRAIARLGIQAAEALDHAHRNGILHRDIKPANLFVDDTGKLWITDFGLARMEQDAGMTMSGDLLGTLRYMSPEQALAKRVVVDHRSDIYSLGVTLYELVTLQPAYAADDRQELLRQIAFEEPRKPRHVNARIPQDLETIIRKAIEKNPNARYSTAQDLADDLRSFVEQRPIRAKPASLLESGRKWARRRQPAVWASAVALAVSTTALALAIGWAARDRAARQAIAEGRVKLTLTDAEQLASQGKWVESLSALERADDFLDIPAGGSNLGSRIQDLRKDIKMVVRLEEIRLERMDVSTGDEYLDSKSADLKYDQAFRDYGIDLAALESNDAAARIRGRSIGLELALALEDWAYIRRSHESDDRSWKRLVAVARVADPDEWRNRLRDALEAPDSERKSLLGQLAASFDAEIAPAPTAVLLGRELREAKDAERSVAILQAAQQRYPGDLFVNLELVDSFGNLDPPNWDAAIRFSTAALAIRPSSPTLYNILSVVHYRKQDLDAATSCLKHAIRLKPDLWYTHANLGEIHRRQGVPDKAIVCFKEAVRLKVDEEGPHAGLVQAAEEAGALDELIAYYKEEIRRNPGLWLSHQYLARALDVKGEPDEAVKHLQVALQLTPDNAELHFGLAQIFSQIDALDEAIASYKEALRHNKPKGPKDTGFAVAANFQLAETLRKKGSLDEAIAHFKEVIRLNPDDWRVHQGLGEALADNGQRNEAITSLIEARRLLAYNGFPYPYVSDYLSKMGALDEAIAFFNEKLRVDANHAGAHSGLADALYEKGELDLAIAHYKQAIRLRPEIAGHAYLPLASAFRQKGALDEAIQCFEELIPITPKSASLYMRLAHLLSNWPNPEQRQPVKALELAKEAVRLAPSNSDMVWIELAAAHYRNGQWQEAGDALDQALQRGHANANNEDAIKHLWLAMIKWQLGDKAAARTWYDKAVERIENPLPGRPTDLSPDELNSLRAEAADMLGVEIPTTEKPTTE